MRTIWKYSLELKERQVLVMPERADVLNVQLQNGTPTLWAEVETSNPMEERPIWIVGTGKQVPRHTRLLYVASIQMLPYVWHFYEELPLELPDEILQ